jgi:CRP/FNR family transcriptional regulator, nitrogen oxide reductase regulator
VAQLDRSLISDLPLFDGLPPEALDEVLEDARSMQYPRGAHVFEQGASAHAFFVLLHGRLRVTQVTPEGHQIVVRFVSPGDVFGVAMALQRATYPGTATAVVDSLALVWPNSAWQALSTRYPALALNVLQAIGGRLQEAHARIREISTEEVEQRVAHAVLRLAAEAGRDTPDGVLIDFPISRQDVAEMTGTTLHTVSRVLSVWEAAGWVQGGRQRIVIRDMPRLQELADAPRD